MLAQLAPFTFTLFPLFPFCGFSIPHSLHVHPIPSPCPRQLSNKIYKCSVLPVIATPPHGFLITPAKAFSTTPYHLSSGMLVHKLKICHHHTSIWYFGRGKRQYDCFKGSKQFITQQQLELAGAAPPMAPVQRGLHRHPCLIVKQPNAAIILHSHMSQALNHVLTSSKLVSFGIVLMIPFADLPLFPCPS